MTAPNHDELAAVLADVEEALTGAMPQRASALLQRMHPSRLADVLESVPPEQRSRMWKLVDPGVKGDVLVEAHGEVRRQLIEESDLDELAGAVARLDLDALSDIYDELPEGVVEAVLRAMDARRRQRFEMVRAYPEDAAGGLMDVDAIAVRADMSLGMVLNYLARYRQQNGRLPQHVDSVMVVALDETYLGQVSLGDLVSLDPAKKVLEVMDRTVEPIPADMEATRVARLFEDRDLVSAPVVDGKRRLIGRITVDDVVDVIREQAEHSAMATAGLDEEADTFAPAMQSARRRALWLGINLVNAFIAAWVIGVFDYAIDRLVALAVLMPVVASMGGVAGTQSLALAIRGIALDQLKEGNRWRFLRKELAVGALNGLLWALAVALVASAWFRSVQLGTVFGAALIANLIVGVVAGSLVPMVLDRLRIDPALAGGVVLVALTDAFGFFAFLGLATTFLI